MSSGRDRRTLVEALFERVRAAQEAARTANDRARLLVAFLGPFRDEPDQLPVRCAWCGRLRVGAEWAAPDDFLAHGVPERLHERTTHGICPECLDRQTRSRRSGLG